MISGRLQWSDRYPSIVTFLLLTIEKHSKRHTRCKFTRTWHPSESFRHAITTLFFAPSRSRPYTIPRVASVDIQTEWPGRIRTRMRMTEIAPAVGRGVVARKENTQAIRTQHNFQSRRTSKGQNIEISLQLRESVHIDTNISGPIIYRRALSSPSSSNDRPDNAAPSLAP